MRRLKALFKENTELLALSGVANKLVELQQIWDAVVPPQLRPYARAGGVLHRRITVFADNAPVAAKLKLLAPSLLKNLQNKGVDVTSIRVEVQVISRARQTLRPPLKLSAKAAASLESLAETLPESPLATSLQRLARHARDK